MLLLLTLDLQLEISIQQGINYKDVPKLVFYFERTESIIIVVIFLYYCFLSKFNINCNGIW